MLWNVHVADLISTAGLVLDARSNKNKSRPVRTLNEAIDAVSVAKLYNTRTS